MKTKLFSKESFLVSLKGMGSSIITFFPLMLLAVWVAGKNMIFLSVLFWVLAFVSWFFFWGWISNRWWGWK